MFLDIMFPDIMFPDIMFPNITTVDGYISEKGSSLIGSPKFAEEKCVTHKLCQLKVRPRNIFDVVTV